MICTDLEKTAGSHGFAAEYVEQLWESSSGEEHVHAQALLLSLVALLTNQSCSKVIPLLAHCSSVDLVCWEHIDLVYYASRLTVTIKPFIHRWKRSVEES